MDTNNTKKLNMNIQYKWLLILLIFGFIACDSDDDSAATAEVAITSGSADFSTYVALGNSLTAGFTDGALFIAGILPGVLLAVLFSGYVIIAAIRNPDIAPPFEKPLVEDTPEERRSELIGGLGILALILLVIGGIWTGLFTPTEAAGFGAIGALVIGIIKGMRGKEIIAAIFQAGKTTAPIMFLLITAQKP